MPVMGSSSSIRQDHLIHGTCVEQAESFPVSQGERLDSKTYRCAGLGQSLTPEAAGSFEEIDFRSCKEHEIETIQNPFSRMITPSTEAPESEDDRCRDLMVDDCEEEDKAQERSNAEKVETIAGWPDLPGVAAFGLEESADEDGHDAGREADGARSSPRFPILSITRKSSCSSGGGASPRSSTSSSHITRWTEPDETLILFDFDDTLCPSGHVQAQPGSFAGGDPGLQRHEAAVIHLLEVARSLGNVQIVTMADNAWVDHCISLLMPGLRDKLTELNIGVHGARSNVPAWLMREAQADGREPSQFLKTRVMKRIIQKFYGKGRHRQRSWKNILSIGDSEAEQMALQDAVFHHIQKDRHGVWKNCRCKTLLLLASPRLEELTAEVKLVAQLLPTMVHHDGDLDMDIDEDEVDAALQIVQ